MGEIENFSQLNHHEITSFLFGVQQWDAGHLSKRQSSVISAGFPFETVLALTHFRSCTPNQGRGRGGYRD